MDVALTYEQLSQMQNLIRAYLRGHNCPAVDAETKLFDKLVWTAPVGSLSLEGIGTVRWDSSGIIFVLC